MTQYERKQKVVDAVVWTGNLKDLPRIFRARKYGSVSSGRLVTEGGLTVIKRGNVTAGVRVGDWLLMDEDGYLEVMSEERFKMEYEPVIAEEKAV